MAFIRKRGHLHQLIETYREGGKVKQRVLANLSIANTIPEAIKNYEAEVRIAEFEIANIKAHIKVAEDAVERQRKWREELKAKYGSDPYIRAPENQGVEHAWPYYKDPERQAAFVADLEKSRQQRAKDLEEMWKAFRIPVKDSAIKKEIDREIFSRSHVKLTYSLHSLRKMLPEAERRLTKARENLEALKRHADKVAA